MYRGQRRERALIEHALQSSSHAEPGSSGPAFHAGIGQPIGVLEIPRLHLSVAVVNGADDSTLHVAAGHLPDTPMPWERGNSAIAAHRDTFFRSLSHIRMNDEVRMVTPYGEFHYRVRHTLVVRPEDVWVLSPTRRPCLTLLTCYPFWGIGAASSRFIVEAESIS
jgi:sortase A